MIDNYYCPEAYCTHCKSFNHSDSYTPFPIHNIIRHVLLQQCFYTSESSDGELPIHRELGRLSEEESHQEAVVSKTAGEGSGRRGKGHEEKGWFRFIYVSLHSIVLCFLHLLTISFF
jgi:hypothetical protein